MGVKSNFSQAVSELIGISKAVEPEQNKDEMKPESAEENMSAEPSEEEMEAQSETDEKDENGEDNIETPVEAASADAAPADEVKAAEPSAGGGLNPSKERIMAMLAQQQAQQQVKPQVQAQPAQQVPQQPVQRSQAERSQEPPGLTTIAKGTVIIGEINAEGDVELLGSVKGKVASHGDIRANGKVVGDLIGRDIELVACAVQGNIIASGLVTVDGDSVVIGDVKGENFCLDGKIKGNVTVENEAKFQPKAILAGNVTTASIAMSQGAKIQGEVNIPLSEKETDMSFDVDILI